MIDLTHTKLLLCDLDGTLALKWEPVLLPGRITVLKELNLPVAIVTNQGGVHAGYAWKVRGRSERAARYPTVPDLMKRMTAITRQLPMVRAAYLALYVGHDDYPLPEDAADILQTLPTGAIFHASWERSWRKPDVDMLLQACSDFGIEPAEGLMVGDREDDRDAAGALGMPFLQVDETAWTPGFFKVEGQIAGAIGA